MISRETKSDSVKVCPKTGRLVRNKAVWKTPLIAVPVAGFAALVWFCVRVIPKPSRIHHPCQQVALPLASGFLFWLGSLAAGVAIFRTSLSMLKKRRFVVGAACLGAAVAFLGVFAIQSARPSEAKVRNVAPSSLPCGVAKGIFPGRVVWARNLAAANENCTQAAGDYWWMDKNTDSTVVEKMVSDDLRTLTATTSDSAAWVALFKYFNKQRYGLENTGYTAGEKIVVKINLSSAHDMTRGGGMTKGDCLDMTDTSPQIMRAILKQLINVVHAAQTDIYLGDPGKPFFDQFFSLVQPHFPKVNYIDVWGISGRMPATATAQPVIFYSDRNLPDDLAGFPRQASDKIPQCFVDARYLISLAPLKAHESAGLTACAKNHFGSQLGPNPFNGDQGGAWHLHYALPSNGGRPGYGVYRNLVDLMGHQHLGGKTLLSVLDALWSGNTSTPIAPGKWKSMSNTYPSSIFMSQDIVAIEAVGLDFLKAEYTSPNYTDTCYLYPTRVVGIDDYLYQAADPANWPDSVAGKPFPGYDPNGDSTLIGSLGTYDHWNNATDKQYSRNLDPVNGKGIELVTAGATAVSPGSVRPAQAALAKSKSAALYSVNGRLVAKTLPASGMRPGGVAPGAYIDRDTKGECRKVVPVN